jgi:hypothetical protein
MSTKFELPTKATLPQGINPRTLLLYASPKQGKSSLLAGLEQFGEPYLIIDTEKGQHFLESVRLEVKDYVEYFQLLKQIRDEGKPYKYLAIDTITGLDNPRFVGALALQKYRETPAGKADPETKDVLGLEWGLGYHFQREAFKSLLKSAFASIPEDGALVMTAHVKDKILATVDKKGETSAKDINLPGKLREIACSNVDAVGLFQRRTYEGKQQGVVTFQTSDQNVCGLRCKHLSEEDNFLITELQEDGSITTFWDKIFI